MASLRLLKLTKSDPACYSETQFREADVCELIHLNVATCQGIFELRGYCPYVHHPCANANQVPIRRLDGEVLFVKVEFAQYCISR